MHLHFYLYKYFIFFIFRKYSCLSRYIQTFFLLLSDKCIVSKLVIGLRKADVFSGVLWDNMDAHWYSALIFSLLYHWSIIPMTSPVILLSILAYLSSFDRRFWTFLPLGLLSLPTHWTPPGPVTRCDSRPFDDFLKVNSTASPSFRLRKPSMCNLLWKAA